MSIIEAIVLGVVQGLTEFLPISSSAHQRIVAELCGWDDPGAAFTAVTQLGTESAVLLYFRRDLTAVASAWFRSLRDPALRSDPRARVGWYLIVATIPIGILGLAFEHQIETGARNLWLIGSVLILFALVLGFADRHGTRDRGINELRVRDGVMIGFAQSLALIPGVSRSGATMSAGLLLGLTRPEAARFSFLLAVPAVLLSGFFELAGILSGEDSQGDPLGYIALATVISFGVGLAAIAWLLRYLASHTLDLFVGYRIVLGSAILALLAAGVIS
jgi:undecaprenyl-diphosphatase